MKENLPLSGRHAPIFVVGTSRSGSTMLRLMLNRHPELAIPPESHFLIPLVQDLPLHAPLSPEQVKRAAEIITEHPRFESWCTTAEVLTEALLDHPRPTLETLVDTAFRTETAPTSKPRWGDKTPEYTSIIDRLGALFPGARFIHIVRDGRDTSISLKQMRWYGWTAYERANYWQHTVLKVEAAGEKLGPSRYTRVFYEDLVLSPETTLQNLCDFLEIPMHGPMLSFHEDGLDRLSPEQRRSGHHHKVSRPSRETDVARWRRESSWISILLFEAVAGKALDREDYPRRFAGARRCLPAVTSVVYSPIGATITALHHLFDSLPNSTQGLLRDNTALRRLKRMVTR